MKYLRLQLLLLLSVVVGLGSFAQETNKPDWRQLHYLSQEEMEAGLGNRLTNFTATAAPTGTIRFPGEFEPMQAVMVRYPLGLPTSFIKTLAEECKVITLVSSSSLSAARNAYNNAGVNMDNCEFVTIETDSYWVRDYCPWYIFVNKSPAIVDFRYNRERESDDIAPVTLAENYFNIPWYGMDVTHTGGNMMQDGRGFGMSDDLVVTESAQYSNINESTIKQRMNDYLGIDNYLITDDPQGLYIAHIDCWGKLLAPDKILIAKMPETDSRYQNYEDIANYFENTNCCWGYPYKVYRVNEFSSSQNATLAPYTNSLILNNRVFVPLGSNTTYNNNALAVYREAMPGYTVIGVASNSSYAWQNTDALHCRTRGVMDFDMLFVDHRNVIHGEQELQDSYAVTSTFIPYSGQDLIPAQTVVYYRINGGEWQSSPMTSTSKDDEYTGYITGCTYGATVEYYVSATDESGHTATQPVMGASDPHSFTIKDAPTTYTITATADPEAGGTITGAGVYNLNDNVVLTATPVGSYVFVNWTDNGDVVSTNATYSFNAERDRDLVAHFESTLHWTPVSGDYPDNMPMTAIIQIDGEEQFTSSLEVGMFCGDECRGSAVGELFPYNGKYILSIILFGATDEEYSFRLYNHSTDTELTPGTLNAPANVTFNADGYGTPTNPYVLNFTSVIQEYTVTVTANPSEGGTATVSGTGTFEAGDEATVTATANTGYTFFNWSVDGHTVSTDAEYTFTVNGNKDLVANFNLNTYNITVNVNPAEGGSVTGAGTYNHGETVTLSATANENYRFIGWMENGEVISSETSLTFTAEANRVLTAKFSSTLYWTATPGNSENNMTMSAYILIDNVEQFGNTLEVGVFVGDECRASAIGVKPPFSEHYILSLLIYGDADESFSFRLYDHTSETELTPNLVAPANVNFNENGYGSPVNPYPLNFTSQTPEYTINVEANPTEGGSVAITGENPYLQNTEITVTATPNTGYSFVNWTVGEEEVSTDAEFTFNADADKTLVANFALIEYTVTITANPTEGGSAAITEAGPYHYNDVINLTHTENANYEFVNFTVNGSEISSPYTVTSDVEIVANFELNTINHPFSLATGWNWWSTYIEMNGVNGLQLLTDAVGENATEIKSQNHFLLLEDGEWDGNLTAIANEQMYRLYAVQTGNFAIDGLLADPADHTITLRQGWNWIGYVESTTMEHNAAMASLTAATEDDCLKSYTNFATYYEGYGWYGDLEVMEPGQGYMMRRASAGSLTYASSDKESVINSNHSNVNNYWKPVIGKFPDNMNVLTIVELDGNELRTEDVELAAFDENGECRGSAMLRYVEPIDRYVAFLTVYGENEDALHFRAKYQDAFFAVNEQLTMMADEVIGKGTEPYKMTVKGAGLDEISANLSLYPNPVGQGQEVRIELPESMGNVTVEIIDVMGRVLYQQDGNNAYEVATPETPGIYTVRVTDTHGNTHFGKLIVK